MIFFWKNSVDFWHRKLTLKVQFWHFLTNHNSLQDCFKKIHVDSWAKSCILGPTIFKILQPNWHYYMALNPPFLAFGIIGGLFVLSNGEKRGEFQPLKRLCQPKKNMKMLANGRFTRRKTTMLTRECFICLTANIFPAKIQLFQFPIYFQVGPSYNLHWFYCTFSTVHCFIKCLQILRVKTNVYWFYL